MKKLNKAVALGMAGTMALSLTACGGGSSTSTSASASTGDSTASAAASSDEVVTLKWVAVGSGMPSNYDAWLAQINPYLEEKSVSTSIWRSSPGAIGRPAAMLS